MINDLKKLERGYQFPSGHYRGFLLAVKGDTPATAELCGFKEGVGFASRKCRNCMVCSKTIAVVFSERDTVLRNMETHCLQCRRIDDTTGRTRDFFSKQWGINRRSCLMDLENFDVTQDSPQDCMHVIYEGYAHHIMHLVIINIGDNGVPELMKKINCMRKNFRYSHCDKDSIPGELILNQQTFRFIKQKAIQIKTLLKILPFILSKLVDVTNKFFVYFMEFIEIVHALCAPLFTRASVQQLEDLIKMHLRKYSTLFADTFLPKMHYLIHLPRQILLFGPPARWTCMREEAMHKRFKGYARNANCNALDMTIANAHQKYVSSEFADIGSRTKSEMHFEVVRDVHDGDYIYELFANTNDRLFANNDTLSRCNHVTIHGTKYSTNISMLAVGVRADLPIFGRLVELISVNGKEAFGKFKMFDTVLYKPMLGGYIIKPRDVEPVLLSLLNMLDCKPLAAIEMMGDDSVLILLNYSLSTSVQYFQDRHND